MKKKIFLSAILLTVMTCFRVVLADSVEIGNIISTVTDSDTPITSEITNIIVEGNSDITPLPTPEPDDGNITAEIGNISIIDNGSVSAQSEGLLNIMAVNEESTGDKLVTVTFDLKNSSARAAEFQIYSGVYGENDILYSVVRKVEDFEAGEKRQVLLNIKVPNNGKDVQGKLFIWDDNMKPSCNAAGFTVTNSNPNNLPDITITDDMILRTDMYYNNVNLTSGTIDLHGHKLFVNGNLLQSGGIMYINNGELVVNGDYRIQTKTTETDQYGTVTVVYKNSSGILNMTNENDRVLVNGDFYTKSYQDHSLYLQNGVLELKGNFEQLNWAQCNFNASKNHKVVFSGSEQQTIYFADIYSGFASAEFENEDIMLNSNIRGWTLTTDLTLNGDIINNSLGVSVPMNLNGYQLHIKGNYVQSAGEMYINNGSLVIDGDYRIQYQYEETDQYGDTKTVYGGSSGILNMTNENDRVLVNGNFYTQSNKDHSLYLQNGVFELKGNFEQLRGASYNFDASKNHKVVFSGNRQQAICFCYTDSGFANVEFKNEDIMLNSNIRGWTLTTDLTLNGDIINNSLGVSVPMNLNGYQLHIKGNYVQSAGEMYINNGSLVIDGDYRIQHQYEETDRYGDTQILYGGSSGILNMTHENDRVLVNGNFYTQSNNDHSLYLQSGVLELKGNFEQLYGGYNSSYNFNASKNHKVVFSGNRQQAIYYYDTCSGFANVEFKHEDIMLNSNIRGWTLTTDLTLNGDIINNSLGVSVPMNLNGFQLHIKGNYV